jgi:internalin A
MSLAQGGIMTRDELLHLLERAEQEQARVLDLSGKGITQLPAEIGHLTGLTRLDLSQNRLTQLPVEIGGLTNLTELDLYHNYLTQLPAEIGCLGRLVRLNLHNNDLRPIPPEIGRLGNLTELDLSQNRLTQLPAEIGRLANLTTLNLRANHLTQLVPEIGRLTNLAELDLDDNPLASPPPEIVGQGRQAVLTYLRGQLTEGRGRLWRSKMVIVGEGGVGKTSLLRALRGEPFNSGEETTHGMQAHRALELQHPQYDGVSMRLFTWDFGGQQIYHATHQFFLTDGALFLLVWNARQDSSQGRLEYWLDAIRARAPGSPVLLVATHLDERSPTLPPVREWQQKYRVAGHFAVSNKDGRGIAELRGAIAASAAGLPRMGQECPRLWIDAARAIQDTQQYLSQPGAARDYFQRHELLRLLAEHSLDGAEAAVLLRWYHDLGGLLHFPDDPELRDLVILNPWWVSRVISRVLDHEDAALDQGLFTRDHGEQVWGDLPEQLRAHFLRLMEHFDLSYRIPDSGGDSLVVARLPADPPEYEPGWNALGRRGPSSELAMHYHFSSIPAGIPTWFIARSHRFSTGLHWRHGALLRDGDGKHLGLVRAFPHERRVELAVRGPYPQNFFALLRDGLELTLARFPGLQVRRTVPCPHGNGRPCAGAFEYEALLQRHEKGKERIECQHCGEEAVVAALLFGWGAGAGGQELLRLLHEKVEAGFARQQEAFRDLAALAQRNFTTLFNTLQRLDETHCPNVFTLVKRCGNWLKEVVRIDLELQLFCQAPGHWHPTAGGGRYTFQQTAKWLKPLVSYLKKLHSVLRCVLPVTAAACPEVQHGVELMGTLLRQFADRPEPAEGSEPHRADGAALRALRQLLRELDPSQTWGGLQKVLTPEGHYLWLCPEHARVYQRS